MKRVVIFKKGQDYWYTKDLSYIIENYVSKEEPSMNGWRIVKRNCKLTIILEELK